MDEHEAAILASMFSKPVPEGRVRWWEDDGQGGGWIEYITPDEYARREAERIAQELAWEREAELAWDAEMEVGDFGF
jgi:hypothetical protein